MNARPLVPKKTSNNDPTNHFVLLVNSDRDHKQCTIIWWGSKPVARSVRNIVVGRSNHFLSDSCTYRYRTSTYFHHMVHGEQMMVVYTIIHHFVDHHKPYWKETQQQPTPILQTLHWTQMYLFARARVSPKDSNSWNHSNSDLEVFGTIWRYLEVFGRFVWTYLKYFGVTFQGVTKGLEMSIFRVI